MKAKPPTYRQRAIDTGVNNVAGLRDLLIDLSTEIDKLCPITEPPVTDQDETINDKNETEEN